MAVSERRVAVLGAGTIGEALIAGLLSGGWRQPGEIVATGRREERVDELREKLGVEATLSNADAVADAVLSLPELRTRGTVRSQLRSSGAAGITWDELDPSERGIIVAL